MQRSTASILLFAVVLVAAAVWVGSRHGADPEVPDVPSPVHPIATSHEPAAPTPAAANGLRVRVAVTAREQFVVPPLQRVHATTAGGAPLDVTTLAGPGSSWDDDPTRAGLALAAIAIEGGGQLLRQADVPAAGHAYVTVGARIVARGVVKDDAQRPMAGARVWFGESDKVGIRRDVGTDENGRFELDTPAGPGVPFVVQANERASQWQAILIEAPSPELAVVLQPATRLTVQLATQSTGIEAARVFVVPHGDVSTEISQWPFFLQAAEGGAAVDATGGVVFTDLPVRGSVGIVAVHPLAPIAPATPVMLQPKPLRSVVQVAQSAARWNGRVVDDGGRPLAGITTWSRPGGVRSRVPSPSRMLPPVLDALGAHRAFTDWNGEFAIGGFDGADATLSLRSTDRAGRDLAWPVAAPDAIVLHEWRGGEPSFRLSPPRRGVAWSAECGLGGGIHAELAADQPWTVSFPHAGRFDIVLTTMRGDAVIGTRTVQDVVVTGVVELESPPAS